MVTHSKAGGFRLAYSLKPWDMLEFFQSNPGGQLDGPELKKFAVDERFRMSPERAVEVALRNKRRRLRESITK